MKYSITKNILIFLLITLFFLSSILPMVFGNKSHLGGVDMNMGGIAFVCSYDNTYSKLNYYKHLLSIGVSNDCIIVVKDLIKDQIMTLVELPTKDISIGHLESAWPMQSHDNHHTGRSPYSTANNIGIEKWRFETDGWVEDTPIIDDNGIIYFGGNYGGLPYYLFALYLNGTLRWKYKTDGLVMGSSPAIAEDGTIYVGSWDDYLYAMNLDGTRKWRFNARSACISSSPAIADDGTIYFGTLWNLGDGGKIFAVNPDGTEKWYYQTGYHISSDPAIGDDGTIYIGSGDSYLYAMNPDGTLKWRFKTGDEIHGHPSIDNNGIIYIGSWDDYLYAIYSNGTLKWKVHTGWGTSNSQAIDNDGIIYVGTNKLYAIYPNGTVKWSFNLGETRKVGKSSPAISNDGTIYIGVEVGDSDGGEIIAINIDGTEKWRKRIANKWSGSSPSIAEDGTVYIGSADTISSGFLHAFGPQEFNDPPTAPSITGPTEGKVGTAYNFEFLSIDPDKNPVSFYIEWGDGTKTGWTNDYNSGEKATYGHTWSEKGSYTIKAKARDTFCLESDWETLTVTIPRDKAIQTSQFLNFLQCYPNLFLLLQKLIQQLRI